MVVYADRQTPDGHCQLVNLTRADRCRAVRQPGRPTGKQAGRQTDGQLGRQVDSQPSRHTDRLIVSHPDTQTASVSQRDRQPIDLNVTDTRTDWVGETVRRQTGTDTYMQAYRRIGSGRQPDRQTDSQPTSRLDTDRWTDSLHHLASKILQTNGQKDNQPTSRPDSNSHLDSQSVSHKAGRQTDRLTQPATQPAR